jgi:hypothetical protein
MFARLNGRWMGDEGYENGDLLKKNFPLDRREKLAYN